MVFGAIYQDHFSKLKKFYFSLHPTNSFPGTHQLRWQQLDKHNWKQWTEPCIARARWSFSFSVCHVVASSSAVSKRNTRWYFISVLIEVVRHRTATRLEALAVWWKWGVIAAIEKWHHCDVTPHDISIAWIGDSHFSMLQKQLKCFFFIGMTCSNQSSQKQ